MLAVLALTTLGESAMAQDVSYSWFEIGVIGQDASRSGSDYNPLLDQTVDINTKDGTGVRFRGSIGTWHNLYAFFDYASVDPAVDAVVTNSQGEMFPASDEFDLTTITGGFGYKYSLNFTTDLYAEVSYDSLDFDFGSFAGENFDTGDTGPGATIGIRKMFSDNFQGRAHARYTSVGNADLDTQTVSSDTLFGIGFGYTFIRGLSIELDYETGDIDAWSLGIRLGLDED
ncbi:MAG TPA: hypothetical protein PKK10_04690 [Woeseiaceae bacterium]|nr:hypothetical protein [Woeseiaceae bacterium]